MIQEICPDAECAHANEAETIPANVDGGFIDDGNVRKELRRDHALGIASMATPGANPFAFGCVQNISICQLADCSTVS